MVRKSFAHLPKLRAYIESRGRRLPTYISKYVRPGVKDSLCLFCDTTHNSMEVMLYPKKELSGAEGTGAFMCNLCYDHVREMEASLAGYSGLADTYDSLGVSNRIEMFVNNAEFETSVTRHFTHIRDIFEKIPEEMECCYFCKNNLHLSMERGMNTGYFLMKKPLTGATYIDGGKFKCCFKCRDLILELLPERNISAFYRNRGMMLEECPACKDEYLIDSGEFEYRSRSGNIGNQLCPECAVTNLTQARFPDTVMRSIFTLHSENYLIERFHEASCFFCTQNFEIDLTFRPSSITTKHISKQDHLMCEECANGSHGPLAARIDKSIIWMIYSTDVQHRYYVIVKTMSGRLLEKVYLNGDIGLLIMESQNTIDALGQGEQSKLKF